MFDAKKLFAERIGGEKFGEDTTVYKFEKIKRAKRAFQEANPDIPVIDLGVGEHDGIAPMAVRNTVKKEVDNPENKGYADNGIFEFQQAAAKYLNEMLGINIPTNKSAVVNKKKILGADDYIIHGIGSKGILSLLPLPFVNPGESVIMTVPGYPVLGTHSRFLGANVEKLPLREENKFLPDLEKLAQDIPSIEAEKGKVKIVCVNYPNNPTGADANPDFWKKMVEMAHEHNFIIAHDAAYSELTYKGKQNSPLQADGGMDVSLGIYSLSKAFNMIGYRLAFIAGNPDLIAAYGNIKDDSDSGQSKMLQRAGVTALEHPESAESIKTKYNRRLSGLVEVLNKHGFKSEMPDGTFFLYTKAPTGTMDGRVFKTGEEASQYMLLEQGISVVPWDDAGPYIRFSATFDGGSPSTLEGEPHQEEKIFKELDKRLGELKLKFD